MRRLLVMAGCTLSLSACGGDDTAASVPMIDGGTSDVLADSSSETSTDVSIDGHDATSCVPDTVTCEGTELVTCDGNGSEVRTNCLYGCDADATPPACVLCPADMVHIPSGHCIDRYEASQDPADPTRAASVEGVLPWAAISQPEAETACAVAGKRLCTRAEWEGACSGPSSWDFPYGGSYQPAACNNYDRGAGTAVETGSIASCEGGYPDIFDMSGNVWEWIACSSDTECRGMGGSYHHAVRTSCTSSDLVSPETRRSTHGFRCCLTPGEEPILDGGTDGSTDADGGGFDADADAATDDVTFDVGPASCGSTPHGGTETRDCYSAPTDPCATNTQSRTCDDGTWSPDWPSCDWFSCGSGAYLWAHRLPGMTGTDMGYDVAMDGAGNAFVAAGVGDDLSFTIESSAPDGSQRWIVFHGGTASDEAHGIATDSVGNVFATGYSRSVNADFGGGPRPGNPGLMSDVVVASYGNDQTHRWSHRFTHPGNDAGNDTATDTAGNVYVAGVFGTELNVGGNTFSSAGGDDSFVGSYDNDGNHRWSDRFGGAGDDVATAVATDSSGNVYVTGTIQGDVDLGGGVRAGDPGGGIFLASYTSAGGHRWSIAFPGGEGEGNGIATTGSHLYLVGSFRGGVDFGGGPLANASGTDIFLARFTTGGVHVWSDRWGAGSNSSFGQGVAVDGSGNAYITGRAYDHVDFGGGEDTYYHDIFVVSFDAAGAYRWHTHYERWNSLNVGRGIAVGPHIVITGQIQSTMTFDGHNLPGWADDGFVLAMVR